MHPPALKRIALFALTFGAVVTGLRLLIVLRGNVPFSLSYLSGIPISFCLAGFYGLLFGYLAHRGSGIRAAALLTWIAMALVILINVICFHYEAVFGRLPGMQLLFYLDQTRELSPSLDRNLPAGAVAIEVLAAMVVLALAWKRLGTAPLASGGQRLAWLAAVPLVAAIAVSGAPGLLPEGMRWSSREPLIWFAQSAFIKESYDLRTLRLTGADFDRFLQLHGRNDPGPVLDPAFPLCRPRPPPAHAPTGRSVIVLILESVGYGEMTGEFRGEPMMPNLRRIAAQNASFTRAVAPGAKSSQTMAALFSGLPPSPFDYYLWRTPLLNFDGLPRQLRDAGYDTFYLHGGDLAFERQRPYLQAVGFDEIREFDQRRDLPAYGWGYDDATMFAELQRWVEQRKHGDPPYLATLFTLSTHDPYILPGDWPPVFSSQTRQLREPGQCCRVSGEADDAVAAAEAFRFLDVQLGKFYAWYETLPDPPLLVMVGDHAPHIVNDYAVTSGAMMRFDVALVFAGAGPASANVAAATLNRPVAVHDVPVTLAELLGIRVHPCMIGSNLFETGTTPGMVYAAGPESMEQVHFWLDDGRYRYDRVTDRYDVLQAPDPAHAPQALESVRNFVAATFPVHYYLLMQNAYFPQQRATAARPALPPVTRPLFVAHRGNLNGPQAPELENSSAALEQAAASPVPWIEVDVQITADGALVLLHDPVVTIEGREIPVVDLTLADLRSLRGPGGVLTLDEALARYLPRKKMLIELKPQERFQTSTRMVRALADLLERHSPDRVLIDSFDEYLATSMARQCRCRVGVDTPFRKALSDADLDHYQRLGVDWIYVEHSVVDAHLVNRAHARGLKVMAYTVNDRAVVEKWRTQGGLPDGIITDYESVARGD